MGGTRIKGRVGGQIVPTRGKICLLVKNSGQDSFQKTIRSDWTIGVTGRQTKVGSR